MKFMNTILLRIPGILQNPRGILFEFRGVDEILQKLTPLVKVNEIALSFAKNTEKIEIQISQKPEIMQQRYSSRARTTQKFEEVVTSLLRFTCKKSLLIRAITGPPNV